MAGLPVVLDAFFEEAGLRAELEACSPFGEGQLESDLGEQGALEGAGGAEFGAIGGESGTEAGAVLGGEGQTLSVAAVFDGVAAAACLASGVRGPVDSRTLLRLAAIWRSVAMGPSNSMVRGGGKGFWGWGL